MRALTDHRRLTGISLVLVVCAITGLIIFQITRPTEIDQQDTTTDPDGALLYQKMGCDTCHGETGPGIPGRGPALNNPHLFGYDFAGDLNTTILNLEEDLMTLRSADTPDSDAIDRLTATLTPLYTEREQRLSEIKQALCAGYLPDLVTHVEQAEQEQDPRILTDYLMTASNRLLQANWTWDIWSYAYFAIAAGHTTSTRMWDDSIMPPYADLAGGPLDDGEIWALVDYIVAWDQGDNWTADDFLAVEQYSRTENYRPVPSEISVMGITINCEN